jgi:hypothetical protein
MFLHNLNRMSFLQSSSRFSFLSAHPSSSGFMNFSYRIQSSIQSTLMICFTRVLNSSLLCDASLHTP